MLQVMTTSSRMSVRYLLGFLLLIVVMPFTRFPALLGLYLLWIVFSYFPVYSTLLLIVPHSAQPASPTWLAVVARLAKILFVLIIAQLLFQQLYEYIRDDFLVSLDASVLQWLENTSPYDVLTEPDRTLDFFTDWLLAKGATREAIFFLTPIIAFGSYVIVCLPLYLWARYLWRIVPSLQ